MIQSISIKQNCLSIPFYQPHAYARRYTPRDKAARGKLSERRSVALSRFTAPTQPVSLWGHGAVARGARMRFTWISAEAERSFEHWSVALSTVHSTNSASLFMGPRCSCTGARMRFTRISAEARRTLLNTEQRCVQGCSKLRETGCILSHDRLFQRTHVPQRRALWGCVSSASFLPIFLAHIRTFSKWTIFGGRATATCKANALVTDGPEREAQTAQRREEARLWIARKKVSRKGR